MAKAKFSASAATRSAKLHDRANSFRNATGQEIHQKICADCFREWIGMGTKVINELRLPLNYPQAQKVYDQHMMEFLNLQ